MTDKNTDKKEAPVSILFTIVDRGRGNKVTKLYSSRQLLSHTHCVGEGTASSKMMDMLGLDVVEKDMIISMGKTELINCVMSEIHNTNLSESIKSTGILFSIGLSAISNIVASLLMEAVNEEEICGVTYMEQEGKNSLIIVAINQGYTDEMMQTARKAGAIGGTIVKARWSDGDKLEQFHGITLQEERELVFILASSKTRNEIMDAINEKHGLTSEAHGLIFSVPVDRAVKLS
ncbi:hypothetical protein M2150_000103 [Lachnospiraceae bacterium PM6-15]|uniref:hypothetical protein n=1 Tax=Ohessyouella blattaphilus TaxID=2949333 RepID=UPI003E293460